ncbi:MAG: 50S ribosomal protein L23 [Bifidobacteriaceae bacterium]|jgi:large subunit ribosomal protein L23|nr:50S ribosomal protein L23 [Bifidobacteriaceae bacterium]
MKTPYDILITPVISEKSYSRIDEGKYTFVVNKDSNKTQIKNAVESIFDVKVEKVNTLNRKGKTSRTRMGTIAKRSDIKHAIVTLKQGQTIDVFGQG